MDIIKEKKIVPQSTDANGLLVDVICNGNKDRAERLVQVVDMLNVKCPYTGRSLKETLTAMRSCQHMREFADTKKAEKRNGK